MAGSSPTAGTKISSCRFSGGFSSGEFAPDQWWHSLLHNQTSLVLKGALLFRPGIVVTSVPYHLRGASRRLS